MTLTVIGADYSFDLEHNLMHPNRPKLPQNIVLKPIWQELTSADQNKKDDKLFTASTADDFISKYSKKTRKHIAALVYLGANVQTVQHMQDQPDQTRRLLPDVTLMHDIPLTRILLEHGADVHQKSYDDQTAIYLAQTVAIAQVLIAHRALDNLTKEQKAALMHKIMAAEYDPALITLYKENGVYLTPHDYSDSSPIISLIRSPQNYMNTKARLFLDGYSKQEQLSLLTCPKDIDLGDEVFSDMRGYTVFDIIEEQKTDAHEVHVDRLDDLHACLLKIVGQRCSFCPEIVNPLNEKSFTKTKCGHTFCLTCLDDRAKSCPLCPSKLMYYAKRAALVAGAVVIIGGVAYLIKSRSDAIQRADLTTQQLAAVKEAAYTVVHTSPAAQQALYELGLHATSSQNVMTPVSITALTSTPQANAIMPSMKSVKIEMVSKNIKAIDRLETLLNNTP